MDFSDFISVAEELRVLGVRVTRGSEQLLEWQCDEECRRNVYSVSKSVTSCAVGFAVQEGLLSLREPLTQAFPSDLPEHVGEHLQRATVRDLLTMCLGQEQAALMGGQRPLYPEDDWVRLSLSIPLRFRPGTHFVYSNVGPYLAGMLVQRRAGCDLVSYLMPRLFTPLGIKRPTWETDPLGNTFGAGGLMLTLSELHKFGLFYRDKGVWKGERLLAEAWIDESTRASDTPRYGYLFWRGEYGSFRADGKYSQLVMVLPEKDAVITLVSECRRGEALLRAVYDLICARL